MINIEILNDDEEFHCKITGHAGYAERGKDIVCAAVSILSFTLYEFVLKHEEMVKELHAETGDGKFKISFLYKDKNFFQSVLEAFVLGITRVSENYKDYVKVSFLTK